MEIQKAMETAKVPCLVNRFDHLEMAVHDVKKLQSLLEVFGFTHTQTRKSARGIEHLMVQGQSRMLLTQGAPGTFAADYVAKHGDGICSIAFHSLSARDTLETALSRGAEMAQDYIAEDGDVANFGQLHVAKTAIRSFGDVRATFVERSSAAFNVDLPFAPGFEMTGKTPSKSGEGIGLLVMDHLTNNVEMGQMERWAKFYREVYGWEEVRYFDIRAEKTGLFSKVLQSPDGAVKIPVNEATEKKSQVQEFIDMHKGAGVQHIAFTTNNIAQTVKSLKERGIQFLDISPKYYEELPKRISNFTEPLPVLKDLNILVDGDDRGYLLQIFTHNQVGPLFFEIIQRKGHNGFGEGNFTALFESIERDQMRRGVL